MEPFADNLQIAQPLVNRLGEYQVFGDCRRERESCRPEKRVRVLAVKPQGQRELDRGALGDGAERMRDDRAVGAPVDPRRRVDGRGVAAAGSHMAHQQVGKRAAAGKLLCLGFGSCGAAVHRWTS